MCRIVHDECTREQKRLAKGTMTAGDATVCAEVRRVARLSPEADLPASPAALANLIMHTAYLGTGNSSDATRSRAKLLAEEVGTWHLEVDIDLMVAAVLETFASGVARSQRPAYESQGGSPS